MERLVLKNKYQRVPKKLPAAVLKAEKTLRTIYPNLYRRFSGWRNCGFIDEVEQEYIKGFAEIHGIKWSKIRNLVYAFINIRRKI